MDSRCCSDCQSAESEESNLRSISRMRELIESESAEREISLAEQVEELAVEQFESKELVVVVIAAFGLIESIC